MTNYFYVLFSIILIFSGMFIFANTMINIFNKPKAISNGAEKYEIPVNVIHTFAKTETISFDLRKHIDTHACYDKTNNKCVVPISGEYTVRKNYNAGDLIDNPSFVERTPTN